MSARSDPLDVAIDIGGTFTDIVALRGGRRLFAAKVPSTPSRLLDGVREAVESILRLAEARPADVSRLVHGTTIATNAVLVQGGARLALFATAGFEDVLEIGRLKRSRMYDVFIDAETPVFLAPRRLRYGIEERMDHRGEVVVPLNEEDVRAKVRDAVGRGVEAMAICYLFGFKNPEHERRTREIVLEIAPSVRVSTSEVHPAIREYERTVLTAFDAYVRPIVEGYVKDLAEELASIGVRVRPLIMQSRGGVISVDNAVERPVTTLLSGPAGGVIGGKFEAERSGVHDAITVDIGGTSCDVSLVAKGKPLTTNEGRIQSYPLSLPMIDVSTIGAGGGSVAWIDAAGGLRVGPQSAGAEPGPACYGRGGTNATVTDASVVLGYLNPEYFAGGQVKLDVQAARDAVAEVARRLQLTVVEAALAIHRVTNAAMADQIRLSSVRRGYDPRRFALVALGGAGPIHCGVLARELGIPRVVVPRHPGVLSAFGMLVAPIEQEHTRPYLTDTRSADLSELRRIFAELDAIGQGKMSLDGVPLSGLRVSRSADMRYEGQSYELEVTVELGRDGAVASAERAFHALHQRVYAHSNPDTAVEFVALRAVHSHRPAAPRLGTGAARRPLSAARKAQRLAFFREYREGILVPTYERELLRPATSIRGPAVIEQRDTTTVVYPASRCRVDAVGNLIVEVSSRGARLSTRRQGKRVEA